MSDHKGLLSASGMAFLQNDSNSFLDWRSGANSWNEQELQTARSVISLRKSQINKLGAEYIKFIIPEKSVIYRELLPDPPGSAMSPLRPALQLSRDFNCVHYLCDFLESMKGFAPLYFRGDSHTNWFGAFCIYRYVHQELGQFLNLSDFINLAELDATLVRYSGDLLHQVSADELGLFNKAFGWCSFDTALGHDIKYTVRNCTARRIAVPDMYDRYQATRKAIVTETSGGGKPSAVIFRDSTCDFLVDFLSEHFSRAIYIWDRGNVYQDVIKAEKPDVVLHFMAERFVSGYPNRKPFN